MNNMTVYERAKSIIACLEQTKLEEIMRVVKEYGLDSEETAYLLDKLSEREKNDIADMLPCEYFAGYTKFFEDDRPFIAVFFSKRKRDEWVKRESEKYPYANVRALTLEEVDKWLDIPESGEADLYYEWDDVDSQVRWMSCA